MTSQWELFERCPESTHQKHYYVLTRKRRKKTVRTYKEQSRPHCTQRLLRHRHCRPDQTQTVFSSPPAPSTPRQHCRPPAMQKIKDSFDTVVEGRSTASKIDVSNSPRKTSQEHVSSLVSNRFGIASCIRFQRQKNIGNLVEKQGAFYVKVGEFSDVWKGVYTQKGEDGEAVTNKLKVCLLSHSARALPLAVFVYLYLETSNLGRDKNNSRGTCLQP